MIDFIFQQICQIKIFYSFRQIKIHERIFLKDQNAMNIEHKIVLIY